MEERDMKKIHLFIVTLITFSLCALFVACEKDEEIDLTTISVSKEQFTPSYTSAALQCSFNTKATLRNVYVQYTTAQDFAEYEEREMSNADGVYSIVLDSLQDNTTYYVRYAVSNRYSSAMIEEISTFQTLQPSVPTIALKSISDIWDIHAKAEIALEFDGGSQISEMGICWNTQTAPVVENNKLTIKDTIATLEIKDLQPNTQYFVRAYAINKVGVAYSEEFEFTTFSLPEIRTEDITDIHSTIAMLHGTLVFNGNDTATIKGFCWSTNDEPTLENSYVEIDTTSATYTYRLSNRIDETQYYVRAYAQNKIGLVYGETKSFTTQSALPPTLSINEVTNVEYHTATIAAEVTSDGGASVTERGICYSTTENPTIESNKVVSGKGTGDYTANLTGLQDSTTYYVRAYAVNKKGTAYGEQVSFMTKGYKLPTITTANPTNVEYTSATVGGNVTSDGGAIVTERGVVYSTSQNPTTLNNKVTSGNGTGSFTCSLNNLQAGTTYYVRAYAKNKKGTTYGVQKSFTTKSYALPTVTTSAATNITYTSATIDGNVTADGGATITERGVVYSTSQNPTTSNSKVVGGSGLGSFSCSLSNLQDGTTYYVRAFARNSKGTAYGNQIVFATNKKPIENGHEYVDLGLSVKWATCNVGAESPEECGTYFQWGETNEDKVCGWSTYKWCNGYYSDLTKYNENDNITTIELCDDAASVNWGGAWRMPTSAEWKELLNNCTWKKTSKNGTSGYIITATNGNSIFLPFAGYLMDGGVYGKIKYGFYWSSSLNTENLRCAYRLDVRSNSAYLGINSTNRNEGQSVRPVCK